MRAVRCEPWGGIGCPWSLTKDVWGECPAAVPAQVGRGAESPGMIHWEVLGKRKTCL